MFFFLSKYVTISACLMVCKICELPQHNAQWDTNFNFITLASAFKGQGNTHKYEHNF